jgi:glycosyltransferase involved in cell wall biosynthesis
MSSTESTAALPERTTSGLSACRVVTWSESARFLLAGQLAALREVRWSIVSGDEYPDPPADVAAYWVPMRRELALSDFRSFWNLVRFFRRHRFAFVQTHTPKASLLGLPAARLAGLRTLYTMHGCLFFKDNSSLRNVAGWVFERWCAAWAHRVLLQSREDTEVVTRLRICSPRKVVHVGNGIDLRRFMAPVEPRPPAETPTVLMISRLVAEKGCRDFFRVAQALHGRARFVHVGPPETDQRDAISREEMRGLSTAGHVEFVGSVDDVRPYLARADLVLLPSYREGIPRVAMEAAAAGRPVAGYDIRGLREVIPPALGLLVTRGDVEALIQLVGVLLEDPQRLAALGRECQQWVESEFSEEAVVERLRRVYLDLVGPG